MSHTVTINRIGEEEIEFEFHGEHDSRCETYRKCTKSWHRHPKDDEIVGDEWGNDRVGHHAYIDGMWMVPVTNGCGLLFVFESEPPETYFEGLALGTYPVSVEWDGGGWLLVVLPQPTTPTQVTEGGTHV